ncbi:DUF1998 domain-containing protein [Hymenobacter sp. 5516J-16]|uniref:DUF1998 domain-containing protein n=1 Tax=Hymenobacter sp. 5516J-16 TaxID=2932253 RepID=UPI001FD36D5C|nr:DUF1998 domain-containing protein [Hymenobacter sp. 5516J-16]UOQ76543.1 DUF1998 domain-containing protein [Hymenobacter sp. 5516J-16]
MPTTDSLQTRKLCSSYGGVGSLIESRLGALRVLSASEWPYVTTNKVNRDENRLNDDRLLARLRSVFTELRRLSRMPYNRPLAFAGAPSPPRVAVEYFPKWMYCPSCARFDHYDQWRQQWYRTAGRKSPAETLRFDEAPRCDYCFHQQQGTARWQTLEQVRFVMTSPAGSLADVPWPAWALRHRYAAFAADDDSGANEPGADELEESGKLTLDVEAELPEGIELYYRTSGRFTDLKGIRIEARRRRGDGSSELLGSATLSGLFNLRVPEEAMEAYRVRDSERDHPRPGVPMKPVLRASNSVYYPHIVQSLYLPGKQPALVQPMAGTAGITPEIGAWLKVQYEDEMPVKNILRLLFRTYQIELTQQEFDRLQAEDFVVRRPPPPLPEPSEPGEEEYRRAEYAYLTTEAATVSPDGSPDLLAQPVDWSDVPGMGLGLRLDRLKMTSVQTSYTRQQPLDRDAYLAQDEAGSPVSIRRRYTTRYKLRTHTLLGVENYGEGLFFSLDPAQLTAWEQQPAVVAHLRQLVQNQGRLPAGSPGAARVATPRRVLLHTLSHLLIKELEFLCGYPATSLQERLYVGPGMQGLLLYTIAGAEGSYGGLVSLARTGKLPGLLRSALHRATDCAADPICWHTDEQGQGVGGLNLAACASCALLPETSCEEFNSLLDRRLVVDEDLGYFRSLIAVGAQVSKY